jgi:hypothetical protein
VTGVQTCALPISVDEHSKSTLVGLLKDNGETHSDASSDSPAKEENGIIPDPDIDSLTH